MPRSLVAPWDEAESWALRLLRARRRVGLPPLGRRRPPLRTETIGVRMRVPSGAALPLSLPLSLLRARVAPGPLRRSVVSRFEPVIAFEVHRRVRLRSRPYCIPTGDAHDCGGGGALRSHFPGADLYSAWGAGIGIGGIITIVPRQAASEYAQRDIHPIIPGRALVLWCASATGVGLDLLNFQLRLYGQACDPVRQLRSI